MLIFRSLTAKKCGLLLLGSGILAFGLYNVHALSGVTEGGTLGLTLFFNHWFSISPAWSGLILNAICYLTGWRTLGASFVDASIVACGGFSLFYFIVEQFPPLWPSLAAYPLLAAILGAVFVGIGVGLCVLADGAPSGDDALAMSFAARFGWDIRKAYLLSDLAVLALSATYIDWNRLAFSLLSVILSGQLIGLVQKIGKRVGSCE